VISIKVNLKKKDNNYNVEHIASCLNIIIAKYAEKNGNTNNALILMPSKAYKIMSKKCNKKEIEEGIGVLSLFYDWVKLTKSRHLKDMLVIVNQDFFKIDYTKNFIDRYNKEYFEVVK